MRVSPLSPSGIIWWLSQHKQHSRRQRGLLSRVPFMPFSFHLKSQRQKAASAYSTVQTRSSIMPPRTTSNKRGGSKPTECLGIWDSTNGNKNQRGCSENYFCITVLFCQTRRYLAIVCLILAGEFHTRFEPYPATYSRYVKVE